VNTTAEIEMNKIITGALCLSIGLLNGCSDSNSNAQNAIEKAINVNSVYIQGSYSLNGNDFPASQYENGIISLAESNTDNLAVLGDTYNNAYAAYIVAGDYDSQYKLAAGGSLVPLNPGNVISGAIAIQNDQFLDIDVIAHSVRFAFTLNGVDFPVSEYDDALLYLQPASGGERILLGNSHTAPDPVWLMPDTYDVIYSVQTPGGTVPLNQNAVVKTVVIDAMTSGVNVDISTVDFRLVATLDGAAFPVSEYNDAELLLQTDDGDLADLGNTHDLPFNVSVIEGTYDIAYQHETGSSVPANTRGVIAADQLIDNANPAVNIDIHTALITPQYTHNGVAFPVSEYNDAEIFLRGENPDDVFYLGNTHDPSPADVRVIRSSYDIIYRHETGAQVPQNTNAVVQTGIAINADQNLPVALSSVDITGTFTLNGSAFPADQTQYAEFYFRGSDEGDEFLLGNSFAGSGTARLIPGSYDVIYKYLDGDNIPINKENKVMSSVLLDTTKSIRINADSSAIAPVFTLNNQPFPESIYEHAKFYLDGAEPEDSVVIGRSYLDNPNVIMINGSYDVSYVYIQGDSIPVNQRKTVSTIEIP
jgi:hypothetical protein